MAWPSSFHIGPQLTIGHANNGILFNHESPRRGETFVTRKITRAVAAIKHGLQKALFLGNLQAKRDWGFAPEYVEAMWLMLQQDRPSDYVIATGETHTVQEFLEHALAAMRFQGTASAEVDLLVGDSSKATRLLGWKPKVRFPDLVRLMVDADLARLEKRA